MSKKPESVHIVPNSERGGWDVTRSHADRASAHFGTQHEAIDRGRQISQNQGAELFIHGKDGKIRERDSHGKDPFPPKG